MEDSLLIILQSGSGKIQLKLKYESKIEDVTNAYIARTKSEIRGGKRKTRETRFDSSGTMMDG